MKILFVTDLYPVKENEINTPKTLYDFVKEWEKSGVEVDLIKPNFILNSYLRGKPFYKTGQYGEVFNVNYWTPFCFDVTKKLSKFRAVDIKLKYDDFLAQYDAVVAHMPSGIMFADKLGVPFVAGIHNSDIEILTNPVYALYFKNRLKTALYNAKAIACRSIVLKAKLLKLFPDLESKTFVASSGIDENIIVKPRISQAFSGKIKVLTCSHLIKRKNIDKLINAVKGLESFELTVIGTGKEFKKLKKIDNNVKFLGHLKPELVYNEMRKSDIFVLPSESETFGMVYLEAMASGCITVCTKDDGVDGIIQDGQNGFLTLPISTEIRKILLNIKSMDDDSLKQLAYNSFSTINGYTLQQQSQAYLQQIFKFL